MYKVLLAWKCIFFLVSAILYLKLNLRGLKQKHSPVWGFQLQNICSLAVVGGAGSQRVVYPHRVLHVHLGNVCVRFVLVLGKWVLKLKRSMSYETQSQKQLKTWHLNEKHTTYNIWSTTWEFYNSLATSRGRQSPIVTITSHLQLDLYTYGDKSANSK